uniref:Ig-like domain-containing protein n=1 Tax=Spermophilus dauricus TaxID=99837 RepID=A0A8C9PX58_SPEDA
MRVTPSEEIHAAVPESTLSRTCCYQAKPPDIDLFCTRLVFFQFLCLVEKFGVLGGSVTFPVEASIQNIDSIVWLFNSNALAIIQPGVEDKNATIIVTRSQNKERMIFSDSDYSLTLLQLKKNDSGIYRVQMNLLSSQSPFTQEYGLQVYECLSKPKVTMDLQNNKNGTCITNLTCSMEQGGENVTYSWNVLGQRSNKSYDGSILPISWRPGERDMVFICTARNPISSNSSSPILAWKLCGGDCPLFLGASGLGNYTFFNSVMILFVCCLSTKYTLFHCADTKNGKRFRAEFHLNCPIPSPGSCLG